MVGAVIGNYQLVRVLGKGGMGVVYLGQHTLLGRRAAIKVLLPALSTQPEVVNRFFNEARAVTSISDPGIVQVFDFGYHSDGSAFIVMEYLEGEPLDRRLDRLGMLPVSEALRLCRQVANSLAAAHAEHIIHRDLKPENIFLVRDGEVASGERSKILDFGIAKLSIDHHSKLKTHTGMLMGTPMYMSPEQCRGLAEIDHRSDIYSLGCVLFHLLTGQTPFDGEGVGDIISAHIREPAPVPSSQVPEIPPEVDAIVLRCLAKQPAARFQTMAELARAISAVLPQASASGSMQPVLPAAPGAPSVLPAALPAAIKDRATVPLGRPTPTSITLEAGAGQLAPVTAATLSESTGEFETIPEPRRIGPWIAGLVVAAACVAIVVGVVGMRDPSISPGAARPSSAAAVLDSVASPASESTTSSTTSGTGAAAVDSPSKGIPAAEAASPAKGLGAPPGPRPHAVTTAGETVPQEPAPPPASHTGSRLPAAESRRIPKLTMQCTLVGHTELDREFSASEKLMVNCLVKNPKGPATTAVDLVVSIAGQILARTRTQEVAMAGVAQFGAPITLPRELEINAPIEISMLANDHQYARTAVTKLVGMVRKAKAVQGH